MAGVLMRHHHKGHPAAGRHVVEELFHCLQPAGGGADSDNQETLWFFWQSCRASRLRPTQRGFHKASLSTLVLGTGLGRNCSTMSLLCWSHGVCSSV